MTTQLIAADIGNVNLKFRRQGGAWAIEPSLVRAPGTGFRFGGDGPAPRTLCYLGGSAHITNEAFMVGDDALRAGAADQAVIGSLQLRVHSDPYLLLHLYAIIASLPVGITQAEVIFGGGVPGADHTDRALMGALKGRLVGTHELLWGEISYQITIREVLIVPQMIGGLATLMFDAQGQVLTNGALARTRLGLDIGGGTTEFSGRSGLKAIEGTEGGMRIGSFTIAEIATQLIKERFPRHSYLKIREVLELIRNKSHTIYDQGEPKRVDDEIRLAKLKTVRQIVDVVGPLWDAHLAQGEVIIFGGGGSDLAGPLGEAFGRTTRVTLLPEPITRVAEGIERMAKNKVLGACASKGE